MATASASTASASAMEATPLPTVTAKEAAQKRYDGLMMVRSKAIRGKGAWYWAHLEPVLLRSADTGHPEAVKLRCSLCDATFSASNPSRTASEHLKRGTCPNFSSSAAAAAALPCPSPRPISSIAPCSPTAASSHHNRKPPVPTAASSSCHASQGAIVHTSRSSSSPNANTSTAAPSSDVVYLAAPQLRLPPPERQPSLSGVLALLEDGVKKHKSPKTSPGPVHSKSQIESAHSLLSDWLYESAGAGALSLSCTEHPKFRAFLRQVGLPPLSLRDLTGPRLDARFEEARADADARISDALFFQLASDGWRRHDAFSDGFSLINLTVNLPNGAAVYHRAVLAHGRAPSKYAEEVFLNAVSDICGGGSDNAVAMHRCAGIIADGFRSKALRNLENQNPWMVNLSCQLQGFNNLIKHFACELPLFAKVAANCYKLAGFFNKNPHVRSIFHKYQLQELDHTSLLRVPSPLQFWDKRNCCSSEKVLDFAPTLAMLEDILSSAPAVKLVVTDKSYKSLCPDDPNARELSEIIQDVGFWKELDAVHSLVRLIEHFVHEMESDRPLIGQCLMLWNELRSKVNYWCEKFGTEEGPIIRVIDKRFKKNYHPAWSAAFVLDPLYLLKDTSGKYLPPYKNLTSDQEKDVDRLITRLVPHEEAHIVLMELMKWRTEGLDPLYAQAVQMKQLDPVSGKMRVANPQSSRLVWETCLSEFKSLGKVAARLIFLHATSSSFKHNTSLLRWVCAHRRSRTGFDRAQKLVSIAAIAKLERKDFCNEEEKDANLFMDEDDQDPLTKPTDTEASSE
ncbi:hypothetical protein Cni_G28122 [Canna indica]|uniref:DUF7963 domain-containing protein n=1 Tax=Canna indica TaxID=4628 RepID=A0AAQ3L2F4_9LILI|nr:hypothetical protein Cni_G28122 [Canna indica]